MNRPVGVCITQEIPEFPAHANCMFSTTK